MNERLSEGISLRGVFSLCFWFLLGFLLVVHPLFHPLPGLTHFLWSCPKKVSKEMRARDGERLLEFMSQGGEGKTRCAQTVSLPFSSLQEKFKAPFRARKSKDKSRTIWAPTQTTKANRAMGWPFSFDVRPLMAP
ncbi:hypothetical protein [Ralstonia flatus]|uniref:hypothetical protein n=1 Tax=Ralstonia flatus TaxID=3058601 RepID=UPI0029313B7E|nr:hypothetical protein [Ralstonia sp. LMG 32965]